MAKKMVKSISIEEMFNALPNVCKNETIRELCKMFIESRIELGFPFTKRALVIMLNKHEWSAESLAVSLLCATERGWRGVFLPDGRIYSEYAEAYHRMNNKNKKQVQQNTFIPNIQIQQESTENLPWFRRVMEERKRMSTQENNVKQEN